MINLIIYGLKLKLNSIREFEMLEAGKNQLLQLKHGTLLDASKFRTER